MRSAVLGCEAALSIPPYSLGRDEKEAFLNSALVQLTVHHRDNCPEYQRILSATNVSAEHLTDYRSIPFLPVRLFKEYALRSTSPEAVIKTMTSSGTTGQRVSKIYLDRETAALQTKVLTKIVNSQLGKSRYPMIVVDCPAAVSGRSAFSARGAGIVGFSIFGRDKIFALDEQMKLDIPAIESFMEKHRGSPLLLFGFTSIVWQHFLLALEQSGSRLDLATSVLIHGGGWKKLTDGAVSRDTFKSRLRDACGIGSVHDYYGMVEQTGSIYMECARGHLHASIFSDIIIRRHGDFSVADHGERGVIQSVSVLPKSYPGHSLLTEDEGTLLGEDDCLCGRLGKYFTVHGRIPRAEIRGCSDTYTARHV